MGHLQAQISVILTWTVAMTLQGCAQLPAVGTGPERALLGADYPVRWFPRSIRFAPDETNLLVSLCHYKYGYYCRVARYWIAESRWEAIPAEVGVSMAWPDYSPDGRQIVYAQATCPRTYQCEGAEFSLATMSSDGTLRQTLEPSSVQMPTYSPDGNRILFWRVQGSGTLHSGRSIGYWSLYESDQGGRQAHQLTNDPYFGIYGAPRYLADGEHLLYTAYNGESGYTFLIRRDEGMWANSSVSPWTQVKTQFIHAHHDRWGWLVGYKILWFEPANTSQVKRQVLNSVPYTIPVADVSRSGDWVAALSGVPAGTMRDAGGGVANYWAESPSGAEGPPRVPVMTIIRVESREVRAVTNWPADVEKIHAQP